MDFSKYCRKASKYKENIGDKSTDQYLEQDENYRNPKVGIDPQNHILASTDDTYSQKDIKKNIAKEENEKPSKKSPSYLIWSIFTKRRELEKAKILQGKVITSFGNILPVADWKLHYTKIFASFTCLFKLY